MASQEPGRSAYSGRRLSQHQPPGRSVDLGRVGYSNEADTSPTKRTFAREIISYQQEPPRRRASYAERPDEFILLGQMRNSQQVEPQRQSEQTQEQAEPAVASIRSELESAQDDLRRSLEDAARWKKEAEDSKRRWKEAAGELDMLRATGQGLYQVTDDYLVNLIIYLRHNIRDFSIQYFDGYDLMIDPEPSLHGTYAMYFEDVTASPVRYLVESEARRNIIQAFLWKVLCGEVFDRFRWLGEERSECLQVLSRHASPNSQEEPDQQAYRKFQAWRATTVELLLTNLDPQESDMYLKTGTDHIIQNIETAIKPFASSNAQKGLGYQLQGVLDSAVKLDKEICKQVARLSWTFPNAFAEFEPEKMELELGSELPPMHEGIQLVMAPGLLKRGKSTGEGFDVEEQLIKAMVA